MATVSTWEIIGGLSFSVVAEKEIRALRLAGKADDAP